MPSGIYNHKPLSQELKKNLSNFWKGKKKPELQRLNIAKAKMGSKNPNFGVTPTKETLEKRSKSLKGKKAWNKGRKCPERSGVNSPGWRGGISTENHKLRHSIEYRLWRTAVFERDNYTCIWCGAKFIKGVSGNIILNADHIKPFAYFPELRFAIDNGRTLCEHCHRTTDTYAKKLQIKQMGWTS
jgi:hypothetical protein